MTTNSNGGPGKTRHLNDIAVCCENMGMRVICVDAALEEKARISQGLLVLQWERGHCLFLGKPGSGMSITKQQMSRVFMAKSDVSRLRELYSGDDGERLAEAISQNCNIWYPLKAEEGGHDK
ncbi:hypothetical protein S663_003968 [Salmonella enterica subsp. enterica]|nr:hypothetical protein [Salmonella enterica subsp. enterica]